MLFCYVNLRGEGRGDIGFYIGNFRRCRLQRDPFRGENDNSKIELFAI